jgi:hypothetical protein
MPPF